MLSIDELKKAHKTIATYRYTPSPIEKGYSNKRLHINLSQLTIQEHPIPENIKMCLSAGKDTDYGIFGMPLSPPQNGTIPTMRFVFATVLSWALHSIPAAGNATWSRFLPSQDFRWTTTSVVILGHS